MMMRSTLPGVLLLTLSVAATAPSLGEDTTGPRIADRVLDDGVFYPVHEPGPVRGSLAIRDGRIAYLGPTEGVEVWVDDRTERIDLGGRAVTPGLIDSHAHLLNLGEFLDQVDLVGTTSYAEIVDRIVAAAAGVPAGSWVFGRGWDQNDWEEQSFPRHDALSAAVPDHPVWLERIDGHASLLNRRAMEALGLADDIEDPVGGRYLRNENGSLSGLLVDKAGTDQAERLPKPSPADLSRRLRAASDHCLARGLTTVSELGMGDPEYSAFAAALAAGELDLRVVTYLNGADAELVRRWLAEGPRIDPESRLVARGIKLYSDGALGSRGAALVEAYADDPGNLGLIIQSSDEIEALCRASIDAGFQLGIHAIGDRGNLVTLDGLERCFGGPRPDLRFRIEHAQVMRLPDIQRMADLGVIAAIQPTHATSDMPWAEERVGPRRIVGAYAWRTMVEAGARLALGSDFPVERVDPLLGLYAAVSRRDLDGRPEGGWYADQSLTREEALRGFTLDAAYSLFLEHEVGSLEVGKRADLTVFESDPMTVPIDEIPQVRVDLTLVDGEVEFARSGERSSR